MTHLARARKTLTARGHLKYREPLFAPSTALHSYSRSIIVARTMTTHFVRALLIAYRVRTAVIKGLRAKRAGLSIKLTNHVFHRNGPLQHFCFIHFIATVWLLDMDPVLTGSLIKLIPIFNGGLFHRYPVEFRANNTKFVAVAFRARTYFPIIYTVCSVGAVLRNGRWAFANFRIGPFFCGGGERRRRFNSLLLIWSTIIQPWHFTQVDPDLSISRVASAACPYEHLSTRTAVVPIALLVAFVWLSVVMLTCVLETDVFTDKNVCRPSFWAELHVRSIDSTAPFRSVPRTQFSCDLRQSRRRLLLSKRIIVIVLFRVIHSMVLS